MWKEHRATTSQTYTEKQLAAIDKRLAINTDAVLAIMEAIKLQQKINNISRKKNRELEGRLQQSNWFKKLHS